MGPAVKAHARDSADGEFDGQHLAFLPVGEIAGCAVDRADRTVGKDRRVELRRVLGAAFVPDAVGGLVCHAHAPLGPTKATCAPAGSVTTNVWSPPGTSCGSCMTVPP